MSRDGARRNLVLWCTATALVRALWLAWVPPVATWDGVIYARTALRIAAGLGFVDTWNNLPPWRPTAFYPVGYPAILGAAHRLLGSSTYVAGFVNVLAAMLACACITTLSRRAYGANREHLPAALYVLSPGAVMYASTFMTETVSGALLTLAVVLADRHARTASSASAVATGAVLGVAGLVRPQALLLAPVVALLGPSGPSLRARARTLALVGIACCALVLPWTARNCARLDGCALVSVNGGSNLWIGTDPQGNGNYRDLRVGEGCDHVRGEVAKDRCYGALAIARIRAAPLAWLALAPLKIKALLDYEAAPAAYLRDAGVMTSEHAARWIRIITAHHRVMLALAMLATLASMQRRRVVRTERLCVGVVLGSVAVHCVFFGGDRYHFVFAPMLAVLTGAVLPPARVPS